MQNKNQNKNQCLKKLNLNVGECNYINFFMIENMNSHANEQKIKPKT
jgi:hypothetical protein